MADFFDFLVGNGRTKPLMRCKVLIKPACYATHNAQFTIEKQRKMYGRFGYWLCELLLLRLARGTRVISKLSPIHSQTDKHQEIIVASG